MKTISMRMTLVALTGFTAAIALDAGSSAALARGEYSSPYCLRTSDGYDSCHYLSISQCMASRTGNTDMCVDNPLFIPAEQPYRKQRRKPRY